MEYYVPLLVLEIIIAAEQGSIDKSMPFNFGLVQLIFHISVFT